VAGSNSADEGATDAGAAQVFNAVTGAWVRKLLPPVPSLSLRFGEAVAIAGDLALIGAPGDGIGTLHIYNLKTGTLVRTLTPAPGDGALGDQFGCAVSVAGNLALIGSRADDFNQGSAYVFNLQTGFQLAKLTDSSGAAGDYFGTCVAAEGTIGVVSAPNADGNTGEFVVFDLTSFTTVVKVPPAGALPGTAAGSSLAVSGGKVFAGGPNSPNDGKVFVYDVATEAQRVLQPSDSVAGDYFGGAVSVDQGILLATADSNGGGVYLFDVSSPSNVEFKRLPRPDNEADSIGQALALVGNTAVIASARDKTQVSNAGALFIYKPLTRPLPLTKVTAKGDYAPGAQDSSFNVFSDVIQNPDGEIAFFSSLAGPGSNRNKDVGFWGTLEPDRYLRLGLKTRTSPLLAVSTVLNNEASRAVFVGRWNAAAPGDKIVYLDDGVGSSVVFSSAIPVSEFPASGIALAGATPANFLRVVQGNNAVAPYLATACTLRLGLGGTSATSDSGLVIRHLQAGTNNAEREGTLAGATGLTYGQFTDQLAQYSTNAAYTTAVVGPSSTNQAIFVKNGFGAPKKAAQKGDTVSNGAGDPVNGVTFSSFVGVSADDVDGVLYRAMIEGTGVDRTNNEGLWRFRFGDENRRLILRKGVDLGLNAPNYVGIPSLAGVKIARFIAFWQTNSQQLVFVQLTGTGVNKTNDQALILFQSFGVADAPLVLLREGDVAPGCPGTTIGVINRVEVSSKFGQYVVLTTLTGAPKGTELALFRGEASLNVIADTQVKRRPNLILRKGFLFDNQPSKVRSIALPAKNLTAAGAGTTGLGSCMQETLGNHLPRNITLFIDFDNGVRQLMNGIP